MVVAEQLESRTVSKSKNGAKANIASEAENLNKSDKALSSEQLRKTPDIRRQMHAGRRLLLVPGVVCSFTAARTKAS